MQSHNQVSLDSFFSCFQRLTICDLATTQWQVCAVQEKNLQGMTLSSSELSGSMSFSFAFSVLSLNIRTSSWRRSLTTALVWLAEEAGRSFNLSNNTFFLTMLCLRAWMNWMCAELTCHRCCAGWTGWARLALECCLHRRHPRFGSVTFYCSSGRHWHVFVLRQVMFNFIKKKEKKMVMWQWNEVEWIWSLSLNVKQKHKWQSNWRATLINDGRAAPIRYWYQISHRY